MWLLLRQLWLYSMKTKETRMRSQITSEKDINDLHRKCVYPGGKEVQSGIRLYFKVEKEENRRTNVI